MANGDGDFLIYTDMGCAARPPALPGRYLAEAAMTTGGWVVLAAGKELHIQLLPGIAVPLDAGPGGDLRWDLARSLVPRGDLTRVTIAVAPGPPLDWAGVVAPFGGPAFDLARQLASMAAASSDFGREAAWDRLASPAKRAQAQQRDQSLIAAALTYRGRGRLIGPLRGDLLVCFGVSAWR
jgi:hypothetical protein